MIQSRRQKERSSSDGFCNIIHVLEPGKGFGKIFPKIKAEVLFEFFELKHFRKKTIKARFDIFHENEMNAWNIMNGIALSSVTTSRIESTT